MPNQIDGNLKEERSRKLIELSNDNEKEFNQNYIGKEVEVLFEEPHIEAGKTYMKGHTTNYMVVKLETNENLENELKIVKVVDVDGLELVSAKCEDYDSIMETECLLSIPGMKEKLIIGRDTPLEECISEETIKEKKIIE